MSQTTAGGARQRSVEIVVPVYNEAHVLADSIRRLHAHLENSFPFPFRITVADNASTDATWQVAIDLTYQLPHVHAVHLDQKGRGRALKHVWSRSTADVVAYMDVDLSTGLEGFLPLVAPLLSGHSDVAIGSRLHRDSAVVRGPKREFISRSYNLLLRVGLAAKFSDAQCGFKAVRTEVFQALAPHIEDNAWFFDTELLVLAERNGLRIHEVPVDWVDDPDSRVDIVRTAIDDLKGMARITRRTLRGETSIAAIPAPRRLNQPQPDAPAQRKGLTGQLPSFLAVGVACTLAYMALYLLARQLMPAIWANGLALLVTAVANTAANRRYTFGITGSADALRHQIEGGFAFIIGLGLTTGAVAGLHVLAADASHGTELAVLVGANAVATVTRFVLMRLWVFNPRRKTALTSEYAS
ncbi:bifunctional glycosyltransferase family 2/GtrA family protein [Actinacidiphila oryziradicis]|uniref:bifunctional glycosyltransferase family 2/GtrA family protein n=1 Tax=Actinacidiphila oryziradicis TaxID=2571141 RepID=UPI0023F4988D|nr:bifunctional glycosyltransferase family 2/GtrA family protein [Actinacidiphila oryziradicis]MCW2874368.1 putative glycosyltransferase [Actinacidiphila oryziradicis]